jgi:hypothetical protein
MHGQMRGQTARALLFSLTVVLLGFIAAGCEKGYRQVVVVDGDKTEFVTFGPAPKEASQEVWAPKRVVVFRTDSTLPGAPQTAKASGKAGRVYRVNADSQELEEVSEFDLSIPNDTLAYRYGR